MVRKIVVYFLNSPDDFCSNPPQDFTFPKRIPFRFVCKGKRYFSNRPGKKCKTVPQTGKKFVITCKTAHDKAKKHVHFGPSTKGTNAGRKFPPLHTDKEQKTIPIKVQ